MRTLGTNVFDGCMVLKQLTFAGDAPYLVENALHVLSETVLIRYPGGASGWDDANWKLYQMEAY